MDGVMERKIEKLKIFKFETCKMRKQTYFIPATVWRFVCDVSFVWPLETLNIFRTLAAKKNSNSLSTAQVFVWLHAIFCTVLRVQADLELKIVKRVGLIILNIQLCAVLLGWDLNFNLKFGNWISNVVISCISLYCVEFGW